MPELRALYIVSGAVLLGLVAWVVSVLARKDNKLVPVREEGHPRIADVESAPPRSEASPPTEPPAVRLPSVRPQLPSHEEIQDEPADAVKKGS